MAESINAIEKFGLDVRLVDEKTDKPGDKVRACRQKAVTHTCTTCRDTQVVRIPVLRTETLLNVTSAFKRLHFPGERVVLTSR